MAQASTLFISHARTPEELRDEFVSDLNRRLLELETILASEKTAARVKLLKAKLEEAQSFRNYWQHVTIVRPAPRKRNRAAKKD